MNKLIFGGALTALLALGGCGKADEALSDMESIKSRACACEKDKDPAACTNKVQEDLGKLFEKHKETKGSQSQVDKMTKLAQETMECLQKAMGAGGGAAPTE